MSTMSRNVRSVSGVARNADLCVRRSEAGFALVSAIFLLVILSALGAFMVHFSAVQHTTSATDTEGSRAYWAARAGLDWALYQVLDPDNATVVAPDAANWPNLPGCGWSPSTLPALQGALAGFTVTVACTPTFHNEAGKRVAIYQLVATASMGTAGSAYFVQRQLSATASKCRDPAAPVAPYSCF